MTLAFVYAHRTQSNARPARTIFWLTLSDLPQRRELRVGSGELRRAHASPVGAA